MIDEIKHNVVERLDLPFGPGDRATLNMQLQLWFAATNKKPSPDLDTKILKYRAKLSAMAQVIVFYYRRGVLTSEAPGDAGVTLAEIKNGTMWFEACAKFEQKMLVALET